MTDTAIETGRTFAPGDRVRIVENWIREGARGGLGDQIVGLRGTIAMATTTGGNLWNFTPDEEQPDNREWSGRIPLLLHGSSFERIERALTEGDTLAVGDRVRTVANWLRPGAVGGLGDRLVGVTGRIVGSRGNHIYEFEADPGQDAHPDGEPRTRYSSSLAGTPFGLHITSFERIEPAVPNIGTPDPNEPVTEVALEVGDLDAVARAWSSDGVAALIGSIRHTQGEIAAAEAEHAERKERFQQVASKVANDEKWCPVFTKIMDDFGMERVEEEVEEEVGWRTRVTIEIDHSMSDDSAAEEVKNYYDIDEEVSIPGYTTIKAEVEVEILGNFTTTERGCICDEVDSDIIEGYLPEWFDGMTMSFEEGTIYCDRD